MSLPEPIFIERDAEKITQELIAQYEALTGKKLYPAQVERLIIDLIAYREMLIRIGIQEAAKQNLVNFARFPMLDYLGELVGVTRLPAQPARTTLRFSLTEPLDFDLLIPAGTEVETKDGKVIFATDYDVTLRAGQTYIDVTATATQKGSIGNGYLPGEVNSLVTMLPYISVENITTTMYGSDVEDDERLRQRIKEAPEKFSVAGPYGAYRYWAMTAHQDIVDVAVVSPEPGVVNIYPLMKDGNPTNEMLQLVYNTVNDEKRRPLTDMVQVLSPERVDFQIQANITLFRNIDSGTVQETASKKIEEYISQMRSKLGKDIVRSQIIAILNSIYGVYKTDLIAPQSDIELQSHQWANCTGYTINIAGSVDG